MVLCVNICTESLKYVLGRYELSRAVLWMIGTHVEFTDQTIFNCDEKESLINHARKAREFAQSVDELARKSIIQWILGVRGFICRDVRRLIVGQVWRHRIKFADCWHFSLQ